MRKIYDAVVIIGTYTDKQGKEKPRYMNVGAVLQGEKGMSLKLEAIPVGFTGWINFYEPRAREEKPAKSDDEFGDSEIPF